MRNLGEKMKKKISLSKLDTKILILFLSCLALTLAAYYYFTDHGQTKEGIVIGASASLSRPLDEAKKQYEKKGLGVVTLDYSGGKTIEKKEADYGSYQIIFIDDQGQLSKMEENGDIKNIVHYSKDYLVYTTLTDSGVTTTEDLKNNTLNTKVGICDPETSFCGDYTKEKLKELGMEESLLSKKVYGDDVNQVVNLVKSKNVTGGVVYHSTAYENSPLVEISLTDEKVEKDYIVFSYGVGYKYASDKEVLNFLEFLQSAEGKKIFEKYGMEVL